MTAARTLDENLTVNSDRPARRWPQRIRAALPGPPPGADVAAFAALLAANAWSGGAFARLELHGNALHLSEIALLAIALLALLRHGPRRSLQLLRERGALIFLACLAVAGAVATLRGLASFGLTRTVYDLELLAFLIAVPVVVLVADTRERAAWLLRAVVFVCAVAVALFLLSEAVARATDTIRPILSDTEGEVGTGAFYAALCVAAALPLIVRRSRLGPALLLGPAALLLIGLADKRSTWLGLVAAIAVVALLARRRRRRVAVAAAAAVAILGFAVAVDAATEVDRAGTVVSGTTTYTPATGPLDGGFEHNTDGWLVDGSAQGEAQTTTDWSAEGSRALLVEAVATADDQVAYAFACGVDATGMAITPGRRYVASAVVEAGAAPAPGVALGLKFYPGDGSFSSLRSATSRASVAAGETGRLRVAAVAPAGAKIAGITIGPPPLSKGEWTDFAIDAVTVRESGATAGPNLSCGGSSSGDGGGPQAEKEVKGLLGGGGSAEGDNVRWRLDYWRELLSRLGDQPARILTGAGFGPLEFNWSNGSYDFRITGSNDSNNTSGPHNAFVGALYQMGIVGLIGMVGLFVAAAVRLARALRADGDDWRPAHVALAAMLGVSLVLIAFTEALRTPELALFVWTVVGLSLAQPPAARR